MSTADFSFEANGQVMGFGWPCRLLADEARQCLANRHVVFVGDSVTRYQYLSLVQFLSQKQWMWRYGQGPDYCLALEGEWPNWSTFYREGNARISNGTDGVAEEKCDCYRADDGNWAIDNREGKIRENREFTLHHFPLNGMTEHPVKLHVSYFQVMDRPTFEQGGLNALVRALKHVGHPRTPPDAIIMNQGLWAMFTDTITETLEDHFRTIIQTGSNLATHQRSTHLFWKTTTTTLGSIAPEEKLEQLNQDVLRILEETPLWSRLDARQITQDALNQKLNLYGPGDWIHPIPLVYEQINDLFLNFACQPEVNIWGLQQRTELHHGMSQQH
ncbi:hypothetical protein WJX74_003988 [Apatococcus lobatus]|uniref:Uncharacterized protein n=1 Tax=Apatococcus lobatus TaxID=904363 RepID=A0AAW1RHP0_9CHLO